MACLLVEWAFFDRASRLPPIAVAHIDYVNTVYDTIFANSREEWCKKRFVYYETVLIAPT